MLQHLSTTIEMQKIWWCIIKLQHSNVAFIDKFYQSYLFEFTVNFQHDTSLFTFSFVKTWIFAKGWTTYASTVNPSETILDAAHFTSWTHNFYFLMLKKLLQIGLIQFFNFIFALPRQNHTKKSMLTKRNVEWLLKLSAWYFLESP